MFTYAMVVSCPSIGSPAAPTAPSNSVEVARYVRRDRREGDRRERERRGGDRRERERRDLRLGRVDRRNERDIVVLTITFFFTDPPLPSTLPRIHAHSQ